MIIGDRTKWYLDLDLVRHSSEAWIALVPPVSVKDRPLHWILVKSQMLSNASCRCNKTTSQIALHILGVFYFLLTGKSCGV